jgi:hypothetical protein
VEAMRLKRPCQRRLPPFGGTGWARPSARVAAGGTPRGPPSFAIETRPGPT